MLRHSTLAWLLIVWQQQVPAPPPFESGINLVEVDVIALDKRGAPVRGLLVIAATLRRPDGSTIELETAKPDASTYAKESGGTYRVTLPGDLTAARP